MTNDVEICKITNIANRAICKSNDDIELYNFKIGSKYHLNLLYHYTFVDIFETKRKKIQTVFIMDNIDEINLPNKTKIKYIKFISSLQKLIPSIITTDQNSTQIDFTYFLILANISQKSTKKNKNLSALKKFCEKHGLTEVLDGYLADPTYQYVLIA